MHRAVDVFKQAPAKAVEERIEKEGAAKIVAFPGRAAA
jgi:hypothetical protein